MSHVSIYHQNHTNPCCCAIEEKDAYTVCDCGARYTADIVTFVVFTCYDCGRITTDDSRTDRKIQETN